MQDVTKTLQVDIGFLFKKPATFETGIAALQASDPELAEYLRQARLWSERLVQSRNAIEHTLSLLPKVKYTCTSGSIQVEQPQIPGQPVSEFVTFMMDRLACFVEEVTAHCLQRHMPAGLSIREVPLAQRITEMFQRGFRIP